MSEGPTESEDAGNSWRRVNPLNPRPMYYSHIFIDPNDEDLVYVLGTSSYKSEDGGTSFVEIAERPTYDVGVHADHHGLWIDPNELKSPLLGRRRRPLGDGTTRV